MHLFTDYVQPLTNWLSTNPSWALFITFLVSFSESLAVIGSIVPGTVTMTAIGILAGSGVMRIDLTMFSAILGAIAGDSGSYLLGYIFSDKLPKLWPFSKHPQWLRYGKEYFTSHGGKSVLIGRFTGPLRAIIPVIAGMMHMNRWHFLVANVVSAIGWSFLYVLPGVLIGAASSELSAETSTKLFIIILLLLAFVWFLSVISKYLFIRLKKWTCVSLDSFWHYLLHNKVFGPYSRLLTPKDEVSHIQTAFIFCLIAASLLLTTFMVASAYFGQWLPTLNHAVYLFAQSIRTRAFDAFFIIIRLDISYIPLISLVVALFIFAAFHRDWRLLKYWTSLVITSIIATFFFPYLIKTTSPQTSFSSAITVILPGGTLLFATSLYWFLIIFISNQYKPLITKFLRTTLLIILFFSGLSLLYLGESYLFNVITAYTTGFTVCLIHWLLYRRYKKQTYRAHLPMTLSVILIFIATFIASILFFNKLNEKHQPHVPQYVITPSAWWQQKTPILPLYSNNRFGKRAGLLNIQYNGNLLNLQIILEKNGWQQQPDTLLNSLMLRLIGGEDSAELPLLAHLYLNKKPELLMTYDKEDKNLILRMWRSNYHIKGSKRPIYIGSIQPQSFKSKTNKASTTILNMTLKAFELQLVIIPKELQKQLPYQYTPNLTLIKGEP